MKINPGESKAVGFTKAGIKEREKYYFLNKLISEASSLKYLEIIISNNLNWADDVNYNLRNS